MKRSWIGLALLLVLLTLGGLGTWAMEEIHEPIADKLEDAAEQALQNQWRQAAFLTAIARRDWENWRLLRAGMADHGPSEDVDAMFAALEVYGSSREGVAFAALCREMARRIEAIGDAHGLLPENLL